MRFTRISLATLVAIALCAFLIYGPDRKVSSRPSAAAPANDARTVDSINHLPADVVTRGLVLKDGMLYHGVYAGHCKELNKGRRADDCSPPSNPNPGSCNRPDEEAGQEDNITCADVLSYEGAAGRLGRVGLLLEQLGHRREREVPGRDGRMYARGVRGGTRSSRMGRARRRRTRGFNHTPESGTLSVMTC